MKNVNLLKALILFEIKSITRSRYLRHLLLPTIFPIYFGLNILRSDEIINSFFIIIFWTYAIAAIPSIGISQNFFSKDGLYYQALLTRNISLRHYIKGKFFFVILFALLYYIALTPIIVQYKSIIILAFYSGALYYITFGLLLMAFYSSFDKHKIDHKRSSFFNHSGFSFVKLILAMPIVTPLFFWESTRQWGIELMFVFGILGLFLFNFSINLIAKNLTKRKYIFLNL